jgi:NADPH-dependent curcumin reductase CurA
MWPRLLGGVRRGYIQVTAVSNLEAMEELARLVEEKKLKVEVDLVNGIEKVSEVSTATKCWMYC